MERRVPPRGGGEPCHPDAVDHLHAFGVDVGPGDEVLGAAGQDVDLPTLAGHEVLGQDPRRRLRPTDDCRAVTRHDERDPHRTRRTGPAAGLTRRKRRRGPRRTPPGPGAERTRRPAPPPPRPGPSGAGRRAPPGRWPPPPVLAPCWGGSTPRPAPSRGPQCW